MPRCQKLTDSCEGSGEGRGYSRIAVTVTGTFTFTRRGLKHVPFPREGKREKYREIYLMII